MPIHSNPTTIYQLRVTLAETEPAIWRRFLIPYSVTLHRLHLVLQEVMGWTNSHLYRFQIGERQYGELDPDNEFNEIYFIDSHRTKLGKVVSTPGVIFEYEYNFGDSWIHQLVVEKIISPEVGARYPRCLEGERACPPEDCGGVYGYARLLGIIINPKHEEYQETMTWLGGRFYPALFSVEKVNRYLKPIRLL